MSRSAELSAFFVRLRAAMQARGMSQADLARELDVSPGTVSEWLGRGRVPSGDVILRLPRTLGVSAEWLLTGQGPVERPDDGEAYASGARDALSLVRRSLEEAEARFGGSGPGGP